MTVTAPETSVRERIIDTLNTEFTSDVVFHDDKLHGSNAQTESLGGVYPGTADQDLRHGVVIRTVVYVQLFRQWEREVNPFQEVSPRQIEEDAERIRRALRVDDITFPGDSHLWFYDVVRIEYPDDPTGNKTRLLATVVAQSQNAAIVETSG